MSKYIIIFLVVFMSFFGIYNVTADTQTTATIKNIEYSDYLSSAAFDAVKEMKKHSNGNILMKEPLDRDRVSDMFFNSLAMDFGYDTNEDLTMLRMYVPAVVLIDTNGYYVSYNIKYKDDLGNTHLKPVITDINTWSKTTSDGKYLVRYGLGRQVTVTEVTKQIVREGDYRDVYKDFDSPASLAALGFNNDNEFISIRNEILISQIQDTVEYYINNHNEVASQFQPDYLFEMPTTSKDEWVRVLENPTVIAFMQGIRINNSQNYLNIYALSGGEVKKSDPVVFKENVSGSSKVKNYYQDKEGGLDAANQDGYYANDKIVALNNDELVHNDTPDIDDSTARTIPHHHWGDPVTGTGCYAGGAPVYHNHTAVCYAPKMHHHTADCYAMVRHYHNSSCYEYIMHHHTGNPTTGGGCYSKPIYHEHTEACLYDRTLDANNKCKLGLSTTDIMEYELNCDYWDESNLTEEQQKLTDESHILSIVSELPDYIAASSTEKTRIYNEYLENMKEYVFTRCMESVRLTCGYNNGDMIGNSLVCGKTTATQEGTEVVCGKTGTIQSYSLNCGHSEGDLLTAEEASRLNN